MSFTTTIALRVKHVMENVKPTVDTDGDLDVDAKQIAKKAIDQVLSKDHLQKIASLVDVEDIVIEKVTDEVANMVEEEIDCQMKEIMVQIDNEKDSPKQQNTAVKEID